MLTMKSVSEKTYQQTSSNAAEYTVNGRRVISVREAAHRLGVSLSTVYRVDRRNGPFRFVPSGRRIFIDAVSFERYLGESTTAIRPECPVQVGTPDLEPQMPGTMLASNPPQLETAAADTAQPAMNVRPTTGGPQRELTWWEPEASIVLYIWHPPPFV